MWNRWVFFTDLDGGSDDIFPIHLFPQFSSFLENSLHHSRYLYASGSVALRCMSKFAAAFLFWFSSTATSNLVREISDAQRDSTSGNCQAAVQVKNVPSSRHNLLGFLFDSGLKGEPATPSPLIFGEISNFAMKQLSKSAEGLQSFSILSLAAALIPPFDKLSSKVLALPLENAQIQIQERMDQRPCEVGHYGCGGLSFQDLNWPSNAVEPRTGIEFPVILDNLLDKRTNGSLSAEVLVGTGSRTMKIIKIKSLKVYAFGFYVHPYSICEKLGHKYASIPLSELDKHHDFYRDLLREDIGMTVRLVVNCNGMKVNTVKDAFEKSLRARLLKTNPNTDFNCLRTFGSHFTQDIALPAGTVINFRRTADGQLITEVGGNQIGVVHSKELCTAFFDMYIGDLPVSQQTKEEIGRNVASIIRRC
ncbi:hypothetical protein SLA2020_007610 [Shorea laevis]